MIKSVNPFNKNKTYRTTYNRETKIFTIEQYVKGVLACKTETISIYVVSETVYVTTEALDSLVLFDVKKLSNKKKDYTTVPSLCKADFVNNKILIEKKGRLEFEHVEADSYYMQPAKNYVSYTNWNRELELHYFINLNTRLDRNGKKIYILEYRDQTMGYIFDIKIFRTIKDVKEFMTS